MMVDSFAKDKNVEFMKMDCDVEGDNVKFLYKFVKGATDDS